MSDGTTTTAASEAISTQTPFTPGPWRLDCGSYLQHSCCFDWAVVGRDAESGRPLCIAEARGKSDSLLIAAAPDMLDGHTENARILRYLVNELQGRIEGGKLPALRGCLDRCDAAIALATGGQ